MKHTLFISDLHLSADQPELTALFNHFLQHYAPQAEAVYILGDLFEVWIGDDAMTEWSRAIASRLAAVTQQGVPVFIMPGNRDFLLSRTFAVQANCTLLKDPSIIELYGKKILLKHGDDLCILDRSHQWFRSLAQSRLIKSCYLSLAVTWREAIANNIRALSKHSTKNPKKMDVVAEVYQKQLVKHQADLLIHGHTHNPTIHFFRDQSQFKGHMVLSDWHKTGNFGRFLPNGQFFLEYFTK